MIRKIRKNLKLRKVWILFSIVFLWQIRYAVSADAGMKADLADTATESLNQNNERKPKEVGNDTMATKGQEFETGPLKKLEQLLMKQSEEITALKQQLDEQSRKLKQLEHREADPVYAPAKFSQADKNVTGPASTDARQEQPAVQRIDKVEKTQQNLEEQVRKLGPFRFGGDFRFRFDSITRPSRTLADGTTIPNAQNVRMRYRLRFNFDTDIDPQVSFHGQLSTGPYNNGLTFDQDFSATIARHPFLISEAWIDYHPNKSLSFQGGRVQEAFHDNSRFIFDDDVRFNGFNEKYVYMFNKPVFKVKSLELRGGQYIFSNPNVAVIREGDPLAMAGAVIGTRARAAQLFHQGFLFNQTLSENVQQQFGGDVQLYRNPNQIALSSTPAGAALIVAPGLGVALSGPMSGTGNATTTPGGAIYTARNFQIARLTYSLNHKGVNLYKSLPLSFNLQVARNMGTSFERDALLTALSLGQTKDRGDWRFLYVFSIKGANSMISQLTDDDLGTITGVNLRTHHFRVDYALTKKIIFQSLFFFQNELRSSGQFPLFFVPLGAFTPRTLRLQQQLLINF